MGQDGLCGTSTGREPEEQVHVGPCAALSCPYHKGTQKEGLGVPESFSWPMGSFGSGHRRCLVLHESLKNPESFSQ